MSKLPIYLIGFMASGKSKVGKSLAKYLKLDFIDLDEEIEVETGMSIPEIFKREGEEIFRKLEQKALAKTVGKQAVIALGGGAVCDHDNLKLVKQQGSSVYLKVSPEILHGRLRVNKGNRPLVQQLSDEELKSFVEQKLAEREVYYNQADCILVDDQPSAKRIAEMLGCE